MHTLYSIYSICITFLKFQYQIGIVVCILSEPIPRLSIGLAHPYTDDLNQVCLIEKIPAPQECDWEPLAYTITKLLLIVN